MGRLKTKLSIFFDYVKDFLIFIILFGLIILVLSTLVHNGMKVLELTDQYSGEYKNVTQLQNGDIVNLYQVGEGEKTIVILSGYGVQSPVVLYKNLAENLKENYKVVIIEYPGYGFAQSTENERTSENIANDIKGVLEYNKIDGPYILMPHSISNVYAMKFEQLYPDQVQAIISLDGEQPAIIEDSKEQNVLDNTVKNISITSKLEYTGFARILSYVKPSTFYIDLLKKDNAISNSDIKLYRKLIATNYLTDSMINEIKNASSNFEDLSDYQYPENLPVLQILSSENIKSYNKTYSKNKLKNLAENVISNSEIQKVVELDGQHMIHLTNLDEVVEEVNDFISSNL